MSDWCLQSGFCLFAFLLVYLVCLWVGFCLSVFWMLCSVCLPAFLSLCSDCRIGCTSDCVLSVVHFLLALNLSFWFHLVSSGCPYTVRTVGVLSGWVLAVVFCLLCSTWLCSECYVLTAVIYIAVFCRLLCLCLTVFFLFWLPGSGCWVMSFTLVWYSSLCVLSECALAVTFFSGFVLCGCVLAAVFWLLCSDCFVL